LGSCAAEGGSRGSGISTSIVGNVVSVQSGAATRPTSSGSSRARAATRQSLRLLTIARANTEIEGIVVRIEDTDIETQTDSSGAFTLQGDFDGKRTLVFQLPRDSGAARIGVNVPAAGTLTLRNVRIDVGAGAAIPESAGVEFEGIVTETDCTNSTLT